MKQQEITKWGFINALATVIYIVIVALIMANAEKIFGKMKDVLGPTAFLLLFVISAAITGALVLGRPVLLYLDKKRQEAIRLFGYTVGWLLIFMALAFILNILL